MQKPEPSVKELKAKLKAIPQEPGVYLMLSAGGVVLYVGKAKNLKKRVITYFGKNTTLKTQFLVKEICDIDTIVVHNEVEALLLERSLIRQHSPKFNVLLRDDKDYPYVRVDFNKPWPRLEKVRRVKDDKATYVGPFSNAYELELSLQVVLKTFPLVRCGEHEFKTTKKPCQYFYMKRCLGPCTEAVDRSSYVSMLKGALGYLRGHNEELVVELKNKMLEASERDDFELAAMFRDQIKALTSIRQKQDVIVQGFDHGDAFGLVEYSQGALGVVLSIHEGRVIAKKEFWLTAKLQIFAEMLEQFLVQFYAHHNPPDFVLLPSFPENLENISRLWPKTQFQVPQKGAKRRLVEIAELNATQAITQGGLSEIEHLQHVLNLRFLPIRMECVDISNFGSDSIVASNVCFVRGRPAKDHYRLYNIQTVTHSPDDFSSMKEVITRRIRRGLEDGDFPQLLVIDGGRGQLSAVMEVCKEFPNLPWDIVALAKAKVKRNNAFTSSKVSHSFERIFFPEKKESIVLKPGSIEYRLLCQIRDEAHRFALNHHRNKRQKKGLDSPILKIKGVGPVLYKRLLQTFANFEAIQKASDEELLGVKGVNPNILDALRASYSISK